MNKFTFYSVAIIAAILIYISGTSLIKHCGKKNTNTGIDSVKILQQQVIKLQQRKDSSIVRIETKYKTVYQTIAVSTRPDTIIKWLLNGNVSDSNIAVNIAKGKECCEKYDSLVKYDTLIIQTQETAINQCTNAYEDMKKKWQEAEARANKQQIRKEFWRGAACVTWGLWIFREVLK